MLGIAFDPDKPEFATTSADGTIRIWSLETCDQLYEFSAPDEEKLVRILGFKQPSDMGPFVMDDIDI